MLLLFKTIEDWEKFGLLEGLPDDRKEMVVHCFNTATNWLLQNSITASKDEGEVETMILPLFYRIAKEVDLTEDEIVATCKQFHQEWEHFDRNQILNIGGDPELFLVKSFAEAIIRKYKK